MDRGARLVRRLLGLGDGLLPICGGDEVRTYYIEHGWGFGPGGTTFGNGFSVGAVWGDGDSDYGDGAGGGNDITIGDYEHD